MEILEINYDIFQQRLNALLKSKNISNREFAEEIQVTPATISRYLNGVRKPELTPVLRIAKYCNVSVDWLLGVSGEKFDIFPQQLQDIAYAYSVASDDDKKVVDAVLSKYLKKEK